jgi:hypothetical protein
MKTHTRFFLSNIEITIVVLLGPLAPHGVFGGNYVATAQLSFATQILFLYFFEEIMESCTNFEICYFN